MTVLERSLLESMNLIYPEVESMAVEIDELKGKLAKASEDRDMWYKAYCRADNEKKAIEKAQKKEQEAATSNSSDNLKEAI